MTLPVTDSPFPPKAAPRTTVPLGPLQERPLVSVIVPSYNQGRFIRETLESILSQSYRPLEILVIDGASTDETLEVLRSFGATPGLRWWSEPDRGVVEAVNKGFARARGEVGAIQSSDDAYLPGAVGAAVGHLCGDPGLAFVFGDVVKVDAGGEELSRNVLGPFSIEGVLSSRTWIPQPACFFRMDLAKSLGGWRDEVPYAADTDLWCRMMLHARARKLDAFLAVRRMHGEQRDTQGERIIRDYIRVVEDWFEKYGAPGHYRRAAEAGVPLMRNRYGYGEPGEVKLARARRAVQLHPPLKEALRLPSRVRGLGRLRRIAGWVGARIGLKEALSDG